MYQAIDFIIPQPLVDLDAGFIVDPGIGGDFGAALFARPLLGRVQQVPAKLLATRLRVHIPGLDVANR